MENEHDEAATETSSDELTEQELIDAEVIVESVDNEALLAERDEFRDTLLRVKAEFENYKKRILRDQDEVRERANENIAEKLVIVLDACDAAIGHGATDVEPIAKMLIDLLSGEGLIRLDPAGEPFDPNLHEAVLHEEGEGGDPVVTETLRIGYQWKSRVLRPAMVKVKG